LVVADNPKVFLSHASEDKQRFVVQFAKKLRSRGVDVWFDKWEMLPGDSLVDKIFEQGIKDAHAVIIVLSTHSVDKPWVREELNAGMVRRINGVSKLIPVVIDGCQVPECLHATLHERIENLHDFDRNLDRIVMAIFDRSEKPAVARAPKYVEHKLLAGLTAVDSAVFVSLCEASVAKGDDWIENRSLLENAQSLELSEELFCESLEILAGQNFVELERIDGGDITMVRPTVFGFDQFLANTRNDYDQIFRMIALLVVNEKKLEGGDLARSARLTDLSLTELMVNHVVRVFEMKAWIETARYNGFSPCSFVIVRVDPEMTRWLREEK
jgi:hypothetical protein